MRRRLLGLRRSAGKHGSGNEYRHDQAHGSLLQLAGGASAPRRAASNGDAEAVGAQGETRAILGFNLGYRSNVPGACPRATL